MNRRDGGFEEVGHHYLALFILVSIPLLYGAGQEIAASLSLHDDYYFLLRSESFGMQGSHMAPIKEYLFSLFVALSRAYDFSLRSFEQLCYGLSLFYLWRQVARLTGSRGFAWVAVVPLALLPFQHMVFSRSTYDALQLILTPLTLASSIGVYLRRASLSSVIFAGFVAGLHVLTRPEGVLFVAAPLVVVVVCSYMVWKRGSLLSALSVLVKKAVVVISIPLVLNMAMSTVNYSVFGFWAPTFMKSKEFSDSLVLLMAIEPRAKEGNSRYAPVPNDALHQAYAVSPAFKRLEPYFDQNSGGLGWSSFAPTGYRPVDGSIGGGHFQWALYDGGAHLGGGSPRAALEYFAQVSAELRAAFNEGKLKKRFVLSAAVGPDASVLSSEFWVALRRVSSQMFHPGHALSPKKSLRAAGLDVEFDFDRLALRRTALLEGDSWEVGGWQADQHWNPPLRLWLDRDAKMNGVLLVRQERPDVHARIAEAEMMSSHLYGFSLTGTGEPTGNLVVEYSDSEVSLSIADLVALSAGESLNHSGVSVQIDSRIDLGAGHSSNRLSIGVLLFERMAVMLPMFFVAAILAAVLLIALCIFGRLSSDNKLQLLLITAMSLVLILPKIGLLAAIDSAMYPGTEPRYIASSALALYFLAACLLSFCWRALWSMFLKRVPG